MFQPIDHSNRLAAMDIVEGVVAGGRPGDRPEMAAAVSMLMARGSDQAEAVAATATALQEDWPGKYGGANTALMMAGAVAASRTGYEATGEARTPDDDALAAGRFHQLSPERQERVASGINMGTLISARDRVDVAERYDQALAQAPSRGGGGDGHEEVRRAIDMARHELAIGPSEWHGPGDRGAVSFLLHVQAPALLRVAGADDRGDPVNAPYIQMEAERIASQGLGAASTVHGVRHNLDLMRQMSGWLAPTLSAVALSASAENGPISQLAERIDSEIMGKPRPSQAIAQAMSAGVGR